MEKIGSEEIMKYKEGDLVYFDDRRRKGVGKIVAYSELLNEYLVHSTKIAGGHDGNGYSTRQDNELNRHFSEIYLKPFTKKVGQKYKVLRDSDRNFKVNDIVTLTILCEEGMSDYKSEDGEWLLYDIDHDECEVEFYEDAPTEVEATQPNPGGDIVEVGEKYLINGTPVSRETYLFVAGLALSEGETQGSGSTHVTLSINRPTPGQEALTDLGYVLKEISTRDGEIWSKDGHDLVFLEGDFHVKLLNGQKVFTMTLDELHTVHTRLYEIERN